jgi:hypothetical protein
MALQVNTGAGATDDLALNPDGGNVGIGVASPSFSYGSLGLEIQSAGDTSLRLERDGSTAFEISARTSDILLYNVGTARPMRFGIAGTERFRIGANEVVVNEVGESKDFRVEGDTDPNLLFVDGSADRVGIGTTSPQSKLDLGGSTSGQRLTFSNTGVNTTDGARTQAEIGYKTGSYGGAAVIKILTETAFDDSMALAFHTGTSAAETMRIDSNQNVGIGTTSPSMKLNISHGDQDGLRFNCTSTTGEAFIDFGDSGDNDAGSIRYDHNDNSLAFRVNAAGRVRINSSGDLLPEADGTQDLGASSKRWGVIYSADLDLSNEGSQNDVDGTWGSYVIQEGEDDLFLINRRNGKKYKFMLQEVQD